MCTCFCCTLSGHKKHAKHEKNGSNASVNQSLELPLVYTWTSSRLRTLSTRFTSFRSTLRAARNSRHGQSISDKQSILNDTANSGESATFSSSSGGAATLSLSTTKTIAEVEANDSRNRNDWYSNQAYMFPHSESLQSRKAMPRRRVAATVIWFCMDCYLVAQKNSYCCCI